MTTTGVDIRTRLPPKLYIQLERLAEALGLSTYALAQQLIMEGLGVHLGTAKERARLKAEHEAELAALEQAEMAALEELSSKATKKALKLRAKVQEQAQSKRVARLHPADRVLGHLNQGEVDAAIAEFESHGKAIQKLILKHIQGHPVPVLSAFLDRVGDEATS